MTEPRRRAEGEPEAASGAAQALNLEGVGRLVEGDPGAALAAFALALERSPRNPVVLNNLGNALARLGHAEEARGAWEAALAAAPDYPRPWRNLGLLHQLAGDPAQAAAAYRNYLELLPEDGEAWHNLALALHAAGRPTEAAAAFEAAAAAGE